MSVGDLSHDDSIILLGAIKGFVFCGTFIFRGDIPVWVIVVVNLIN